VIGEAALDANLIGTNGALSETQQRRQRQNYFNGRESVSLSQLASDSSAENSEDEDEEENEKLQNLNPLSHYHSPAVFKQEGLKNGGKAVQEMGAKSLVKNFHQALGTPAAGGGGGGMPERREIETQTYPAPIGRPAGGIYNYQPSNGDGLITVNGQVQRTHLYSYG